MKIILATTFRDFRGNDNDKIQYMFLDNLKKQTFKNFTLVTTTFGEKKVKEVVDGYFGERSVVKNVEVPKEYRFSLTDVVLSGIEVAEKTSEDSIIVWCTCDIQLEPTFFQTLVDNYTPGFSGIVHPNIIYNSIDNLNARKGVVGSIEKGIDLLFFDSKVLINGKQDIINYRFYDWGVFEYFLGALCIKHAATRVNLFTQTKIKKIINNRKLTAESEAYFKRCNAMNMPVLDKYINDYEIVPRRYDVILANAHKIFVVVNPNFLYRYIRITNFLLKILKRSFALLHVSIIYEKIFDHEYTGYRK